MQSGGATGDALQRPKAFENRGLWEKLLFTNREPFRTVTFFKTAGWRAANRISAPKQPNSPNRINNEQEGFCLERKDDAGQLEEEENCAADWHGINYLTSKNNSDWVNVGEP